MDTTDSSKTVEEVLEALLEDQSQWTQTSTNVWQAEIPFTVDANYTFDITYTDLVDRKTPAVDAAGYDAIFGESNAPNEFTIDTIVPTANITVTSTKAYEVVSGTLASVLEKVWDFDEEATDVVNKALDTITFGWWSSQAVTVKLESEDELSGVYQLSHFRAANKVDDLTNYTSWTTLGDEVTTTEYTVDQDEQFIVYMSVVDKAGNKLYISSNGLMVDMTETGVDTVNPEINVTPVNELYNEDFNIQVEINDPMVKVTDINNDEVDVYSGLASLTYELTNNDTGEVTQQGTLKDFVRPESETGTVPAMQSYTNDAAITILAEEKNNSNNLELVITATDNAGNVTTTEPLKLSMDITAPEITVSYDNNEDDADFPGYFKEDRTATITVIERNFDAENTEITLENTDGTVIPSTTTWVETTGTGNGDNTKNVATITYNEDGKYEFDIVTTDLAGNEMKNEVDYGDSVEPTEFCIDKTIPEITITYDNNEALNENYYDAVRTATVTITEHNFDASRVELDLVASDNGATVPAPTLSAWTKVGDENIATIAYTADAFYVFDLNFIDMAGNQAEDIDEQQFYVDTTVPELEITGVADLTANNGEVIPIVTYSDTNFNEDTVTITLLGAMRQVVALDGAYANIANGQTFTFNDFGYEKEIDDIYTLNAEVQDMAGNVSTQTITFSVNRFGSTYMFSDATKNLVNTFSNEEHEIVVTEINTDKLTDIILTLFKNDEEIVLIENEDYTITLTGGNGQWYSYEYTIFADNFEDDGVYNLHIHSQDAAGNIAENTFDTKNMDISFGIDKTAPNVIIINLEEGVTYAQELLTVLMTVNDNMKLVHGVVYLDGVEHVSWSEEEITEMVKNSEDFIFDIDDSSISAHEVVVVFTDVAGNETSLTVSDFYVTTNLFVRYYNNKVLFYGSISGAVLLSSAGLYFAMKKKGIKISEEETV